MSNNEHTCIDPSIGERPCPLPSSFTYANVENGDFYNQDTFDFEDIIYSQSISGCVCDYWYEGRVSAGYRYTCEDQKYYVASPNGPVPLTFNVEAFAFWRDQDVCKDRNYCNCPLDATTCSQCSGNCCTACY